MVNRYATVGDGTLQNVLPLFTGKTENELPNVHLNYSNSTFLDGHPFIWKTFKKYGYVTGYAEDSEAIGTFQYRYNGFKVLLSEFIDI